MRFGWYGPSRRPAANYSGLILRSGGTPRLEGSAAGEMPISHKAGLAKQRHSMTVDKQPAPPEIEVIGLSKRFGPVQALDAVSVKFDAGRLHALLGENGA